MKKAGEPASNRGGFAPAYLKIPSADAMGQRRGWAKPRAAKSTGGTVARGEGLRPPLGGDSDVKGLIDLATLMA